MRRKIAAILLGVAAALALAVPTAAPANALQTWSYTNKFSGIIPACNGHLCGWGGDAFGIDDHSGSAWLVDYAVDVFNNDMAAAGLSLRLHYGWNTCSGYSRCIHVYSPSYGQNGDALYTDVVQSGMTTTAATVNLNNSYPNGSTCCSQTPHTQVIFAGILHAIGLDYSWTDPNAATAIYYRSDPAQGVQYNSTDGHNIHLLYQ